MYRCSAGMSCTISSQRWQTKVSIIIEDCKDLAPDVFGHALQHGICRHMRWGRVVRAGDDVSAEELLVAFAALRKNVGYVDGV